MRSRVAVGLVVALLVAAATPAIAQDEGESDGELTIQIEPTFLTLVPGSRAPFEILAEGQLECDPGEEAPRILFVASQKFATQGNRTLWQFDQGSFNVSWDHVEGTRYRIDANISREVVAFEQPSRRVWVNVTWNAMPFGQNTTDPSQGDVDCGWREAQDAMAVIAPGPEADDDDGGPLSMWGIPGFEAGIAALAAGAVAVGLRRW